MVSGGVPWVGFKSVRVNRSMDQVYHILDFETTDRYQEGLSKWNVRGGSDIQVYWESDLIFDGFVRRYLPEIGPSSHSIKLQCDSDAARLTQCSHEGPYFWKNVTAEEVVRSVLAPYEINFDILSPMKPIGADGYRVAVDDSAYNIIHKLAQKNGLTVFTGNDGRLKISDGTNAPIMSPLTTCDYTHFSADHDISRAYSKLIVKSQKNIKIEVPIIGDAGSGALKSTQKYKEFSGVQRFEEVLTNPNQPRYRPLVILHNGKPADVTDFAKYAQLRFSGDSVSAKLTVKSLYDKDGKPWGIEQLVPIFEPAGDLNETLIVSDYDLDISISGLNLTLTLREPRTYKKDVAVNNSLRRTLRRSDSVFSQIFKGIFNV